MAPFVKKMGDKMTYRVALDDKTSDKKGQMAKTWMEAAGREGIPSAFLVDTKGIIAWIGHPMELKEQVIEERARGEVPCEQERRAKLTALRDRRPCGIIAECLRQLVHPTRMHRLTYCLSAVLLAASPLLGAEAPVSFPTDPQQQLERTCFQTGGAVERHRQPALRRGHRLRH